MLLVFPPWRLCLTWCTSQAAGLRLQPPGQAQPSTSLATFLGLMGVVLVMTTNLHHMLLAAVVHSYSLFPTSRALPLADANTLAIQTVGKSFALGLQLAAPVVAFSLIFNIATGLIGRVMPQFQVFFVATPLMVLLGLFARIGGALIAVNMLAAVFLAGMAQATAFNAMGGYALELEAFYFWSAVAVMLLGSGRFSIAGGRWN